MPKARKSYRGTELLPERADYVINALMSSTKSLKRMCEEDPEMPAMPQINSWRLKWPEFNQRYLEAKAMQMEMMADELNDDSLKCLTYIDKDGNTRVDSGSVAQQALITTNKKWLCSKLAPKVFQSNKEIELMQDKDKLEKEMFILRQQLDIKNKKDY